MPHELWQWLLSAAGAALLLDKFGGVALARSERARRWWQTRWLPRVQEERREAAVAALTAVGDVLERLAANADLILAAVTPNGGSSLSDAVTRTDQKVNTLIEDMGVVQQDVRSLKDDRQKDHEQIESLAGLVADMMEAE